MCADHRAVSRRARGARAPCRSPHPAPQKAGGRGPQLPTHSLINAALLCIARHQPTTNARTKNTSRPTRVDRLDSITCPSLCPWEPRLHTLTPAHSPSSTPTCCAHRSHVRWRTLCSSTYAPVCHAALAPKPSPLPHPLIAATLTPATVNRLLSRLFSRWREGKGRLAPPFAPRTT